MCPRPPSKALRLPSRDGTNTKHQHYLPYLPRHIISDASMVPTTLPHVSSMLQLHLRPSYSISPAFQSRFSLFHRTPPLSTLSRRSYRNSLSHRMLTCRGTSPRFLAPISLLNHIVSAGQATPYSLSFRLLSSPVEALRTAASCTHTPLYP
jgi:hypothetical protein